MKIGNIIYKDKINGYDNFNYYNCLDDIDNDLPTIIIGWKVIKDKYPDYDILNRKITDSLYWTFTKNEKRDLYEEDLYYFSQYCYERLINDVVFVYIDPLMGKKNMLKIIKKVLSSSKRITYINKEIVYICCEKIVFSLDLYVFNYFYDNGEKLLNKIKKISSVVLTNNDIIIEYGDFIDKINKVRYIPYLYSIKDEKNTIISNICKQEQA
jgi:hypothetical protein